MNLTIELADEKVATLRAQAEARGLTIERCLEQMAAARTGPVREDPADRRQIRNPNAPEAARRQTQKSQSGHPERNTKVPWR